MGAIVLVGCFAAAVAVALGGCDRPATGTGPPNLPQGAVNVGGECTPAEEEDPFFPGFLLSEASVDPTAIECINGGVCLVNHFQGRASCDGGQARPTSCQTEVCPEGECRESTVRVACNPKPCESEEEIDCNQPDGSNKACRGLVCDEDEQYCRCSDDLQCPTLHSCDTDTGLCISRQCAELNACATPGGDRLVVVPVCSQCETRSPRSENNAVYCSCACAPAEGAPERGPYCACPDGYVCTGLTLSGAAGPASKYCIKKDTRYTDGTSCGQVQGFFDAQCEGTPPPP